MEAERKDPAPQSGMDEELAMADIDDGMRWRGGN